MEPKWLAIQVAIRLGGVGPDLAATTLPWRRVEPDEVVPVGPEHVAVLTECGKPVTNVTAVITRDAFIAKVRKQGQQRSAMSTDRRAATPPGTTRHGRRTRSRRWSVRRCGSSGISPAGKAGT